MRKLIFRYETDQSPRVYDTDNAVFVCETTTSSERIILYRKKNGEFFFLLKALYSQYQQIILADYSLIKKLGLADQYGRAICSVKKFVCEYASEEEYVKWFGEVHE